jgi:hypothetical protein
MLTKTLCNDGISLLDPVMAPYCPLDGFIVGMHGYVSPFDVTEDTEAWENAIRLLLILYMRNGWCKDKCAGIGTWLCGEGDKKHVHFDIIFWTPSMGSAILLAHMMQQEAIFDVKRKEVIYVRADEDLDSLSDHQ